MAGKMVQLVKCLSFTCVQSPEPTENNNKEARSCNPRAREEEEGPWANWPVSLASLVEKKFNSNKECLREDSQKLSSGLHTHVYLWTHRHTDRLVRYNSSRQNLSADIHVTDHGCYVRCQLSLWGSLECRAQGLSILPPEESSPLPPIVDTGCLLSKKPKQYCYLGQAQGVGPKESRQVTIST